MVVANVKKLYPVRRLDALNVELSAEEREARQLLEEYIASREKQEEREGVASHFVHQLLRKRLASSPAAFASALARHTATIEGKGEARRTWGLDERILRRAIAKSREQL